ncbi:MAG: cox cluster protein [Halolamina sp.]
MSDGVSGKRGVLVLYVVIVTVAAVGGLATGYFVEGMRRPALLFLVELPATPLGFATYGAVTVAIVLAVPLVGVVYVSQHIDDPDAVEE